MMIPIKDNLRFLFPAIPDSLKSKYGVNELGLRPFGLGERDIKIDFEQEFRPCLVTQVLQCCTETLKGERPDPSNIPPGCRFHPRCPFVMDICRQEEPKAVIASEGHWVACHLERGPPLPEEDEAS